MKKYLLLFIFISNKVLASSAPSLDQLTASETGDISKEFSSNFLHTTVSPGSPLGKIFGLEIGFIGGQTTTDTINKVSKRVSSSSSFPNLYTAGLIGAVSLPLGLTSEINAIPKITTTGVSFYNYSTGIKWTLTSLITDATFDMAIRGFYGNNELSYQTIIKNSSTLNQNVNTKVSWANSQTGYDIIFSKRFLYLFEPYVSLGQVKTNSDIKLTAASTVSIFTDTSKSSSNAKNSGTSVTGGINLNLFLVKLGVEYQQIMGVKRFNAKMSFYF